MAIWGWSGAILEGWRAENACVVHQNGHLGLVGCHFGGSLWRGQLLGGWAVRIAETTRSPAAGNHHTLSRQRRFYVYFVCETMLHSEIENHEIENQQYHNAYHFKCGIAYY